VQLDCVDGSRAWQMSQLQVGFFQHLADVAKESRSSSASEFVGVRFPYGDLLGDHETVGKAYSDNDLVQLMASSALNFVGCRVRRCAYMSCGWSCRPLLWLSRKTDLAREEIQRVESTWRLT
jgi:hypothetical protein